MISGEVTQEQEERGEAASGEDLTSQEAEVVRQHREKVTRERAELEAMSADEKKTRAEQLREEGNALFRDELFAQAVEKYSSALRLQPKSHVVLNNRSFAFFKLKEYRASLNDALASLRLQSSWSKAYYRAGLAFAALGMHLRAIEVLGQGIKLNPKNEELLEAMKIAKASLFDTQLAKIVWQQRIPHCSSVQEELPPLCGHSAELLGTRLVLLGGLTRGHETLSDACYTLDTQTLQSARLETATAHRPLACLSHGSCVFGDDLYVFGGYNERHGYLDQVWRVHVRDCDIEYACVQENTTPPIAPREDEEQEEDAAAAAHHEKRPEASAESSVGAAPAPAKQKPFGSMPARAAMSVSVFGARAYLFGGHDDDGFYDDLYVFDLLKRKWRRRTTSGTPPHKRGSHSSVVFGSTMYVFGGCCGADLYFNDLHALDLKTLQWSEVVVVGDLLPAPRQGHSATLVGNRMYVFGGMERSERVYLSDMWVFDLEKRCWRQPSYGENSAAPYARVGHRATAVGSRIWMYGGDGGGATQGLLADLHIADTDFEILQMRFKVLEFEKENRQLLQRLHDRA